VPGKSLTSGQCSALSLTRQHYLHQRGSSRWWPCLYFRVYVSQFSR